MSIGEDIPMLIPISIALTIFILFLFSALITFSERNEIITMSETALDITDITKNEIFAKGLGKLDKEKIEELGDKRDCEKLSDLNISSNYETRINISISNSTEWWCWDNHGYENPSTQIKKSLPILIDDITTQPGKMEIYIGK